MEKLLALLEQAGSSGVLAPCSEEDLADLLGSYHFEMPPEWIALLRRTNGSFAGQGGILGWRSPHLLLDFASTMSLHPAFEQLEYVPIAGDGFGNYYVALPADGQFPVGFVECSLDDYSIAYLCGSGVLVFLFNMVQAELGEHDGWLFDREAMDRLDPELIKFAHVAPLPWTVD